MICGVTTQYVSQVPLRIDLETSDLVKHTWGSCPLEVSEKPRRMNSLRIVFWKDRGHSSLVEDNLKECWPPPCTELCLWSAEQVSMGPRRASELSYLVIWLHPAIKCPVKYNLDCVWPYV